MVGHGMDRGAYQVAVDPVVVHGEGRDDADSIADLESLAARANRGDRSGRLNPDASWKIGLFDVLASAEYRLGAMSPSALTLIWTSPFPGGGTSRCSIFRTSGPPVSWNRTTRVMAFSCLTTGVCGSSGRVRRSCRLQHGSRSAGQHQSGRELPDHNGGGVGVGRGDRGHDRGVGDAQALDAADAQLGVYHRFLARSHGAGAYRMEIAHAGAAKERQSPFSAHSHRRSDPAFYQVAEGRLRGDLEPQLYASHQSVDVGLFRQEVGPDLQPAIVPCRVQP